MDHSRPPSGQAAVVVYLPAAHPERLVRAAALPCALVFAWIAVQISPGLVRLLTMWVHETGHAVAAWLCGYPAFPGPWMTPVASDRSIVFALLIAALVAGGSYRAWVANRTIWAAAALLGLLVQLFCTFDLTPAEAQQLIVFAGDGGCLVLGTVLMLTIFAPPESPLARQQVRWGLLTIGALAFVDVYHVWSGSVAQLPFGENENGLSDPSVLNEQFGWTVAQIVSRYLTLARGCLAALGVIYLMGVIALGSERSRPEPATEFAP